MGSLVLQFQDGATFAWMDLWSASTVEGVEWWVPAAVDLPAHAVRVRFIGTTGRTPFTSIGVDALRVNALAPTSSTTTATTTTTATELQSYEVVACDFETDSCSWACTSKEEFIRLIGHYDGLCVDYDTNQWQNASMRQCYRGNNQIWYKQDGNIKSSYDGNCLGFDIHTGMLQVSTCDNGTHQRWYWDDWHRLRSPYNNSCMHHEPQSDSLVMEACSDLSNQKFDASLVSSEPPWSETETWKLALKVGKTPTLGYSSPLWTNSELLNHVSPTAAEEDAKYDAFNTVPFHKIRMCVGSPQSNCMEHVFTRTYENAKALFSSGYIRDSTVRQDDLLSVFGPEPGSYQNCPMQRPGFNIECNDGNKSPLGLLPELCRPGMPEQ